MKFLLSILFIAIVVCFSCENEPVFIKCDDCESAEPKEAEITIKLYNNPETSDTEVSIYEGNLEDSILFKSIDHSGIELRVKVPVNKRYTLTANYVLKGKRYIVVDSVFPRISFVKDQCDEPCYYVYDNNANLKLKYH
ncbi:MAG TPA: hypothetical protein VHO46_07845 [Bacteroidales bacterium]|nr:hypothetical protein [Bacteroidales bacterium]